MVYLGLRGEDCLEEKRKVEDKTSTASLDVQIFMDRSDSSDLRIKKESSS